MLHKTQITQARVSDSVAFFRGKFLSKWGFKNYYDIKKPAIFKGVYHGRNDLKKVLAHRGLAVILWSGTDALALTKGVADQLRKPNIKHIAISNFIAKDLTKFKLKYKRFNISSTLWKPDPQPLGECVYFYTSYRKPNFYGMQTIKQLQEAIPYKIIISDSKQFPYNTMKDIYKKCFIGLRLTRHDGMSNTVVEMGMMGRRCVWNNSFPGAYVWHKYDDVKKAILNEAKLIGKVNNNLPAEIESYFSDKSWMYVETWI